MNLEVLGTVMGSFGGAAVIVAGLAKFLGGVWTDRLAKETSAKMSQDLEWLKAKFNQDIESLKAKNSNILEKTKHELEIIKGEKEQFSGISREFYQEFFTIRISVYLKFLEIKNNYITEMEEEFITEIHEGWGRVYHSTYVSLRKLMIEKQLYISNELEAVLHKLRTEASSFIKEVDLEEAHLIGASDDYDASYENTRMLEIYNEFATSTGELMNEVMSQIQKDVSKLRSRIELDKA